MALHVVAFRRSVLSLIAPSLHTCQSACAFDARWRAEFFRNPRSRRENAEKIFATRAVCAKTCCAFDAQTAQCTIYERRKNGQDANIADNSSSGTHVRVLCV